MNTSSKIVAGENHDIYSIYQKPQKFLFSSKNALINVERNVSTFYSDLKLLIQQHYHQKKCIFRHIELYPHDKIVIDEEFKYNSLPTEFKFLEKMINHTLEINTQVFGTNFEFEKNWIKAYPLIWRKPKPIKPIQPIGRAGPWAHTNYRKSMLKYDQECVKFKHGLVILALNNEKHKNNQTARLTRLLSMFIQQKRLTKALWKIPKSLFKFNNTSFVQEEFKTTIEDIYNKKNIPSFIAFVLTIKRHLNETLLSFPKLFAMSSQCLSK